jgi:hypothetical protein
MRDPGCNSVDDPTGGANAPCTRSNDCVKGLVCSEGVCRDPNAPPPKETDAGPLTALDAGAD